MKKALKVILIILCLILIIVGIVIGMNIHNDHKYGKAESAASVDATDLSQYPTEIDGIDVKYVDSGTFQGFHLIPRDRQHKGIIICYGGSEGSPAFDIAEQYAKEGYETLAVFMFGMKNQQKTLTKIPLEQFEDVLGLLYL